MCSTRVSRVSSGVAPELSLHHSSLSVLDEKLAQRCFRRDAENYPPEAGATRACCGCLTFGSQLRKTSYMSQTWKHPELGEFKHNGGFGWSRDCPLPAFSVFNWEADDAESPAKYELIFEGDSNEEPSAAAAEIGALVVANQSKLATLITHTLWEDFNGRGPESGMWWHGKPGSTH